MILEINGLRHSSTQVYIYISHESATSSYRFIHGYMFRLQLQAIMRPVIKVDTGKIIQCSALIFPL
jgi:hypothetical protein